MSESNSAMDTIAAISTPPGRGGIGIVRLSGPEAAAIAVRLVRLRQPLEHARARVADVLDQSIEEGGSAPIDEAVVTYFAAPNSYTAQDLVEIAAHGSPVVLDQMLRSALGLGARLAEPGEFTQRAFLAGRSGARPNRGANADAGSTGSQPNGWRAQPPSGSDQAIACRTHRIARGWYRFCGRRCERSTST